MKFAGLILMISAIVFSGLYWKSKVPGGKSQSEGQGQSAELKTAADRARTEAEGYSAPGAENSGLEKIARTEANADAGAFDDESLEDLVELINEKDVVARLNDPSTSEAERKELGALIVAYQKKLEVQVREQMQEIEGKLNDYAETHTERVQDAIASAQALRRD